MKNSSLRKWIAKDKFTVGLSIICGFIPPLIGFILNSVKSHSLDLNINLDIWIDVANIFFVFTTLMLLVNSNFLIDEMKKKRERLYEYVQREFDSDCELVTQGDDVLFQRMTISVKQFYYSWIMIWTIWLILYLGKFIISLYSISNIIPDEMHRLSELIENLLNLANSFTMFFIYMVMTITTVKVSAVARNRGQLHVAVILLTFLGGGCFLFDLYSMYLIDYDHIQFYIRLFIGTVATISFMAVLGRLNSSYLDIPQGIIMFLYLYASLQMLYPFIYENSDDENGIVSTVNVKYISALFYALSFLGKILLFMVIRWVMKENRFLFFIIRKANNMSESDDMLKTFNRIYGEESEMDDDD
jgi:hypothetical protein